MRLVQMPPVQGRGGHGPAQGHRLVARGQPVCAGVSGGWKGQGAGKVPRGSGTMRQSPSRETKVRYGVGWKKYAAEASAGQRLVLGWWGKG